MSMKKAMILSMLIPVTLAATLPVSAMGPNDRDGRGMQRPVFSDLDLDGNGELTLEELEAAGQAHITEADTNGDGMLSRDEMIASSMARVEAGVDARLERFDDNEDGLLSANELDDMRPRRGNPERMFSRVDADGDGIVTEAEFEAALSQMMRRGGQQGQDRG